MRFILPILLVTLSFPDFAAQSEPAKPGPAHIIRELRSGQGQPRARDASAARPATLRAPAPAEGTARTRTYQVAKPGEGAPKN